LFVEFLGKDPPTRHVGSFNRIDNFHRADNFRQPTTYRKIIAVELGKFNYEVVLRWWVWANGGEKFPIFTIFI